MITPRRHFLRFAAASLAAVRLAATTRSAEPRPEVPAARSFGFSLYGMKTLPLLDAIDHVARIGYRQLELALLPGFATEPARFTPAERRAARDRVTARRLELSSLLITLNLAGDDRAQAAHRDTIRRAGELAHDLDPVRPPLVETILGGKPDEWPVGRDRYAARLRSWAETAAAAGVTLCVKAHAGQAIHTPDRLLWLFREVNHPSLALTYDYSHYQFAGLGLEESLRAILPHARFIHLKDVAVGEKSPRYLLIGEGAIDYPKYFRFLDRLHYAGPLMVEVSAQLHSRSGYDGVKAAEQAFRFLSRLPSARAG